MSPLENEFKNEWFDNEQDLINFYKDPKNHENLLSGKEGLTKLNLKYMTKLMLEKKVVYNSIHLLKNFIKNVCEENLNNELLDIVTKISIDKLRLDLLDAPLFKREITAVHHQHLKS